MDRRHGLASMLALGAAPLVTSARAAGPQSAGPMTAAPSAAAASDAVKSAATKPADQRCRATSASHRVALVEVFSSEGCSSCPPADRWLSRIAIAEPTRVVPMALHVKYWDYIGWKDPYAQTAFAERQRWQTAAGGGRTVYTPGVFVGGREWPRWSDAAPLARQLEQWSRAAAPARIELGADPMAIVATAIRDDAATPFARPALFVAITESGLSSRITAGENRGETLSHDHVVRRLDGPQPFDAAGRATLSMPLSAADLAGRGLAAIAFVQDLQTAAVLQSMRLPLDAVCARG